MKIKILQWFMKNFFQAIKYKYKKVKIKEIFFFN